MIKYLCNYCYIMSNINYFFNIDLGSKFRPQFCDFRSMRGRLACLGFFGKMVLALPFCIAFRLIRTLFKGVGVILGFGLLLASLGCSEGGRMFFLSCFLSLARDCAGWFFFVFRAARELLKSLFGFLVHPALYFQI